MNWTNKDLFEIVARLQSRKTTEYIGFEEDEYGLALKYRIIGEGVGYSYAYSKEDFLYQDAMRHNIRLAK